MNFVVIGTDHGMQHSEPGFEGLLSAWANQKFFEPLVAIAEEYHDRLEVTSAQRLAEKRGIRWYNLDMTTEEKYKAGILEEQHKRPKMFQDNVTIRVPSDDIREEHWVVKLTGSASGTTIVICGYTHFEALVAKLRTKGHTVDKRVYLETVPEIETLSASAT